MYCNFNFRQFSVSSQYKKFLESSAFVRLCFEPKVAGLESLCEPLMPGQPRQFLFLLKAKCYTENIKTSGFKKWPRCCWNRATPNSSNFQLIESLVNHLEHVGNLHFFDHMKIRSAALRRWNRTHDLSFLSNHVSHSGSTFQVELFGKFQARDDESFSREN